MRSRRSFLQTAVAATLALTSGALDAESAHSSSANTRERAEVKLEAGWSFLFTADDRSVPSGSAAGWASVKIPHTWQDLKTPKAVPGIGWYKLNFDAEPAWRDLWVRLEFEAVNHSAQVMLNGREVGTHIGKGYTAFTVDVSPHLLFDGPNVLLVRVDNRPADRSLPRNTSYDWTDDGGIIRPVQILITERVFIERVEIDTTQDLLNGSATVATKVFVRNTLPRAESVAVICECRLEGAISEPAASARADYAVAKETTAVVDLPSLLLKPAKLWHFDTPNLYLSKLSVIGQFGTSSFEQTFGVRQFEIKGTAFYLNGEHVSLVGVERMAGSNPDFGMAETLEWIRSNHEDMKELNCVFTRVHWPQDRRVLDFCDRHGILMQEEIPAWGAATFHSTGDELQHALEQNGLEQLREVIARDRNHPCIVSWGLCNEVDGRNPRTRQFAHALSAEAKKLDPKRLQTYASNTLHEDPAADMAGDFDFISINEYFGTWTPGGVPEMRQYLKNIANAFPNKPLVISEYGWCECQPIIPAGDENRVSIINTHTDVYRDFSAIAGAIYFDYNDYRTLVGDKGHGALKQRVHGVVDLYARRKPSFEALRRQCSPVSEMSLTKTSDTSFQLRLLARHTLPSYTLRGYKLRWLAFGYDDLPMEGMLVDLPDVAPGQTHTGKANFGETPLRRVRVELVRPTGYSVLSLEYLVEDGLR